jgi:hypothetical protein
MPIWSDFFKLFTYASEKDPLAKKKDTRNLQGAGIGQPDVYPSLGGEGAAGGAGGGGAQLRQTNDMIDTTTLTNRSMRYKEYERLRNVPEIEMTMTVLADEACVSGDTKIATPFGFQTIESLAAKHGPDERFLVYCWDFKQNDYTLGWGYHPRLVKRAPTVTVILDNGQTFTVTPDHQILRKDGTWVAAGELTRGDELKPFYRVPASYRHTKNRAKQFPRIFTTNKGWIHERQFVDEWKKGKADEKYEKMNRAIRMISGGLSVRQIAQLIGHDWQTVEAWLQREGFSHREVKVLSDNEDKRRVVGVHESPEMNVYDLSVDEHKCFATDSVIMHNCQKDEDGHVFKVICANEEAKKEVEFMMRNRLMLNMNRHSWTWFKNLCIMGDFFVETVINPDNPKEGIYKAIPLPPESMYRIETTKGKLIEYQQSKEGPDYQAIVRAPLVSQAAEAELNQSMAIRFSPFQIVHFRIGDDRKTFYPYGQSLIEPARSPAHQLRLMEDAMVVYRLTRAPERRVFYVDVGQLPPFKAEAFMERLKDQFRKRKIAQNRGTPGANQVEERWQPPAADEDYWLPIRPQSQTRIETLPGAQNLGEIDDAIYFRNKLFTALNFPKNYFANEDAQATRVTLSAQDVKFARMIERLQSHFEDGLLELAERHLQLRGYPDNSFEDLKIKMTPPSDWRELSRAEVVNGRYGNATTLKSGQLMADWDIMVKILKYTEDEAEEMLSRLKIQKLEDLKLQVLAQNPQLLGIGIPGQDPQAGQELGSEPGGPSPNPSPDGGAGGPPPDQGAPPAPPGGDQPPPGGDQPAPPGATPPEGSPLPEAEAADVKKFDLEIQDYETEQDDEDIDYSVGGK